MTTADPKVRKFLKIFERRSLTLDATISRRVGFHVLKGLKEVKSWFKARDVKVSLN